MGREEEGLSSYRPELVALRECLEAHDARIDLLCLTDSETSLQVIHNRTETTKKGRIGGNNSADQSQGPLGRPLELRKKTSE